MSRAKLLVRTRTLVLYICLAVGVYNTLCWNTHADAARVGRNMLQQSKAAVLETTGPCPNNLTRVGCAVDPCMRFPCPHGQVGSVSTCGTCHCTCSPDTSNTSASSTNSITGITALTAAATLPTPYDALMQDAQRQQLLYPSGLRPQKQQCVAKYQPCLCSASCCGGLVCGFAVVSGKPVKEAGQTNTSAATSALNTTDFAGPKAIITKTHDANNTADTAMFLQTDDGAGAESLSNDVGDGVVIHDPSNTISSASSIEAAADIAGPACRLLEEVNLRHGVVNYGC